jgi:hypothetical protein
MQEQRNTSGKRRQKLKQDIEKQSKTNLVGLVFPQPRWPRLFELESTARATMPQIAEARKAGMSEYA